MEKYEIIKKVRNFIQRNANHILVISLIFFMSCLLFYKSFLETGQLIYVDMVFPNSVDRCLDFYTTTWNPYGSFPSISNIPRLPWMLLFIIPSLIFNISIESFLLIVFIFTFFVAGVSIYLLTYYTLNNIYILNNKNWIKSFASLCSSLVYMYNPFSLGSMWAYGFYPTYALLPLITLLVLISFKTDNKIYILLTSLVMVIASTSVHSFLWILFLVFFIYIIHIITNFNKKSIINYTKKILFINILYILFSAFWILPAIQILSSGSLEPPYSFTYGMLDHFSINNGIINSIRLVSGTRFLISPEFIGTSISPDNFPEITASLSYQSITNPLNVVDTLWIIFSFFLPIIAFISLILYKKRNKILFFLSSLSLISVFLSFGTNSPLPYFYKWLCFYSPFSQSFGWLLRVPHRWLIFTSLSFSVMFGLSIFIIAKKPNKMVRKLKINIINISIILLIVLGSIYFFYPVTKIHADHIYEPTDIPKAYDDVNNWFEQENGDYKILWLPSIPPEGYFPSWASDKRIGPNQIISSEKESISSFLNNNGKDYLDWLEMYIIKKNFDKYSRIVVPPVVYINQECFEINYLGRMLAPLGVKYIILDTSVQGGVDMKPYLENFTDIQLVFNCDFLFIFENLNYVHSGINMPEILMDGSRSDYIALSQNFENFDKDVAIIDKKSMEESHLNLIKNPSFEQFNFTRSPFFWYKTKTGGDFSLSLDSSTKWSGIYSLRIETNYTKQGSIAGWVKGEDIEVFKGEWYVIKSHMKWDNIKWVHFVIIGFNNYTKKWEQIIHCPGIQSGESDWKEYEAAFRIPQNITKIKPSLGIGWVENNLTGNGTVWFDDLYIYRPSILNNTNYKQLKNETSLNEKPNNIISYEKMKPTEYKVKIITNGSFLLSFAETYDPLWRVNVNGKEYESLELYTLINGFWIDETGESEIIIKYKPQDWFDIGVWISSISFFCCMIFLFYKWKKNDESKFIMIKKVLNLKRIKLWQKK